MAETKSGYDVTMIRDFLEQLKWEVRESHTILMAGKEGACDKEASEHLVRHMEKYGCVLLPDRYYKGMPGTDFTLSGEEWAKERAEQLSHLEALEELLETAFWFCARQQR